MNCNIEKLKAQRNLYYEKFKQINSKIKEIEEQQQEEEQNNKILISNNAKQIKNYPNYLVCANGKIYSLKNKIFLSVSKTNSGYNVVCLWNNNKKKMVLVHRIVAETFIPNPNNYKEVNHKDFDLNNNGVENLEWCSRQYNVCYSINAGRIINKFSRVKINQFDEHGKFIREWDSMTEAANVLRIDQSSISKCCRNKQKKCGGFIWKYKHKGSE